MSYFDNEFYIGPFKELLEVDLDDAPWEFCILGVFQNSITGGLYISTDSGCSCPTPWENHNFSNPEDFTGPLTKEQIIEEYTSLCPDRLFSEDFVEAVREL